MSKKTKERFVVTINGETLPISKCRGYQHGYYKIGENNIIDSGDCYLLPDGRYYRVETGLIVFDHYNKTYVLKSSISLVLGIIDDNLTMGYFAYNPDTCNVYLENRNKVYCMNESLINTNYNFREKLANGCFYHISLLEASKFNKKVRPTNEYKTSLPYDSSVVMAHYKNVYETNYKQSFDLNNDKSINTILQNLSFGLEFETITGTIPESKINKLGVIPLRDGSITGIEYVTVPLSGSKGITNIADIVKELKHRTEYDDRCALHLHLGNVPRTKEFITAFTKLTLGIQDELFSMFNLYKKYNFGYKNKNYSAPFDTFNFLSKMDPVIDKSNIDKNFNVIFEYLSEGTPLTAYKGTNDLKDVTVHPRDPGGNQKWNIRHRYHVHNMIPLIFGNKTTVEFRIHTPTYDIDKIIWFLLFNSILVNYTIENVESILSDKVHSYSLTEIILIYCNNKEIDRNFVDGIIKYLRDRKRYVESFNNKSNIHFEESLIPTYFKFDKKYVADDKGLDSFSKDLYDRIRIDDQFLRNIKPISTSTKSRVKGMNIQHMKHTYFTDTIQKDLTKSIENMTLTEPPIMGTGDINDPIDYYKLRGKYEYDIKEEVKDEEIKKEDYTPRKRTSNWE